MSIFKRKKEVKTVSKLDEALDVFAQLTDDEKQSFKQSIQAEASPEAKSEGEKIESGETAEEASEKTEAIDETAKEEPAPAAETKQSAETDAGSDGLSELKAELEQIKSMVESVAGEVKQLKQTPTPATDDKQSALTELMSRYNTGD